MHAVEVCGKRLRLQPYRKWKPLIWASAQEGWKWMVGLLKLQETVAKKHKVEENYSSEVSPPCREKTVRIRKFCEGFPTHFSENFLEGFHDFSQFCEGFLTHFSDVV